MSQENDLQLVKRVIKGEKEIFSEIIKNYEKPLFYYLSRLTRRPAHDLEDILQEIFIKVYKNLRAFNPQYKFSSWIYRIAHNEAINYLKKHKKEISLENNEFLETIPDSQDLLEELHIKEKREKVKRGIYKLELKYREVLILRYLEEKTYEEISDILRKPVNTIGTLINRAKKQLKEILKNENP